MSERNYYDVLGISPGADGTTVNRAYWQLARKYQGEESADPRSHLLLDELNEAYNTLGTPTLREVYDADESHFAASAASEPDDVASKPRQKRRPTPEIERPTSASDQLGGLPGWAPYAVAGGLAAATMGLGVWIGSPLLVLLGAVVTATAGIVPLRGRLLASWRQHAVSASDAASGFEETSAPERAPRRVASAPSPRQPAMKTEDLRTSTASIVTRFRTSVANDRGDEPANVPDSTLVDIFRSERDVESQSEPLSAVLDVLRGSRGTVETR